MASYYFRIITLVFSFFILASCNVYSPFDAESSDLDLEEAGLKCLHNNDYDCAIEKYNQIGNNKLKQKHLCTTQLAKAGLTITVFINVANQSQNTMLGLLARALVPWNASKDAAAVAAQVACRTYDQLTGGSSGLGSLLKAMGVYVHCATRMAMTDQCACTSNSDTSCSARSDSNGVLTQSDIGAADGSISGAGPGLCFDDVAQCGTWFNDLSTSDTGDLADHGLGEIQGGIENLPAGVTGDSEILEAEANNARTGFRDTVPTS